MEKPCMKKLLEKYHRLAFLTSNICNLVRMSRFTKFLYKIKTLILKNVSVNYTATFKKNPAEKIQREVIYFKSIIIVSVSQSAELLEYSDFITVSKSISGLFVRTTTELFFTAAGV